MGVRTRRGIRLRRGVFFAAPAVVRKAGVVVSCPTIREWQAVLVFCYRHGGHAYVLLGSHGRVLGLEDVNALTSPFVFLTHGLVLDVPSVVWKAVIAHLQQYAHEAAQQEWRQHLAGHGPLLTD